MKGLIAALLLVCSGPLLAGRSCVANSPDPATVQAASVAALQARAALDAGAGRVALIARAGQDLARHDLYYSHVGIAVRDHPLGPWTVVHLLNHCGRADSSVYAEGLLDFYLDGMHRYHSRIMWLRPELDERLATGLLQAQWASALHDTRYNVLAPVDSSRSQNSTGWTVALLGMSLDSSFAQHRQQAASVRAATGVWLAEQSGFQPDTIRVSYGKRVLGGLFSANVDFTDHPVSTRLRGRYPVATVRSIFRWLRSADLVAAEWTSPGAPDRD